jgi:hypothetical protein
MDVDWASIDDLCQQRASTLDRNDPAFSYQADREWRESQSPIEHGPMCNLRPGYSQDPKTWARGCDCGATAKAAEKRSTANGR